MRQFAAGFIACLLLITAIGILAHAFGQTYIVVSGFAQHLSHGSHCHNHLTPGIGLEYHGYALGVYDNSNCDTSAYIAKIWTPLHLGSIKLGAISGLVSGYRASVLPVAGAVATYERRRWGLNLIFIPPYKDSGNVLWVQAKWSF